MQQTTIAKKKRHCFAPDRKSDLVSWEASNCVAQFFYSCSEQLTKSMHPCYVLLLLWTLLPAQGLASTALSVTSIDGSIVVSIDKDRGLIKQITTHNVSILVSAGTYVEGMITLEVSVTASASKGVIVSRLVCFPGHDVPCSTTQILIEEVFVPRTSSIG